MDYSAAEGALARRRSAYATALMSALFFGLGVSVPFLPGWLQAERGLSAPQIAVVLATGQMLRLLVGPVLGAWADGFADRRTPARLLAVVGLACYGVFAFTTSWLGLVALAVCGASALAALTPLFEGSALRAANSGGWPFGIARSIGSSAFIAGNLVCGWSVGRWGEPLVMMWLVASLAVLCLVSWRSPPLEPPGAGGRTSLRARLGGWRVLARRPRLLLALAAAGPIQASHGFFYGFATITWEKQGLEAGLIGALWGFGTLIEVGFFLALSRVERRVAPEWLVLAGGLAAMVRWTAYAFAPPLAWLWPLQGLHALTFAASHLGAMRIVYEEAPQEASGFAGAIYAAVAGGTLLGLSTVGSGWLEQRFGAAGYGAMAILAACGFAATVVLVVSRRWGLGPASAPRAIAAPLGAEAEPRAAEPESTSTEQAKAGPIRRAR